MHFKIKVEDHVSSSGLRGQENSTLGLEEFMFLALPQDVF